MALIEFRVPPYKYISFFGLIAISIFNYFDQLYSKHLTSTGVKRILAILSKFTFGIIYFILIAIEGNYKKRSKIVKLKKFTFKQLLLVLSPGFLNALLYIVDRSFQ